jgi:TolB-like protein/DNA-binding winged helix-turn-helix (wHTH) protein/Tfp pilus assembly protein PilF
VQNGRTRGLESAAQGITVKPGETHRAYHFEDYRLDGGERILEHAGREVPITPTLFEILLTLVENRGSILDTEHFMRRVWAGRVVEDGNLARNISTLRKILGDDPHTPRYIETIARRGYRFVAQVTARPEPRTSQPARDTANARTAVAVRQADTGAPSPDRFDRRFKRGAVLASVVTIALAAVLLAGRLTPGPQVVTPGPIRSLVVLPIVNLSGDENEEHLADGMTLGLIQSLGRLGALNVTSITSSMHYKGTHSRLPEIAQELDREGVVEGTWLRNGDRVSVTVQLVDARTDEVLWVETFERRTGDMPVLHSELARTIAQRIEVELTADESRRLASARPVEPAAYEAYLRGLHFKSRQNVDGLRQAVREFDRALAIDPEFAPAWSAMADTWLGLASWQGPSRELWPKARDAAIRALQLDSTLAEAHIVLAGALLCYDLDPAAAEERFLRGLKEQPNDQTSLHRYAYSLTTQGRFDAGVAYARAALDRDPVSAMSNTGLGRALYYAGRYDEAFEQLEETLRLHENFAMAHQHLGLVHLAMNNLDEAIISLERAVALGGGPVVLGELAYAHGLAGRKQEALARLATLREWTREGRDTAFGIALVQHGLGDSDQAFEWLHKAYDERDFRMILLVVDPIWDSARDDPRFSDLLRRIGLGL